MEKMFFEDPRPPTDIPSGMGTGRIIRAAPGSVPAPGTPLELNLEDVQKLGRCLDLSLPGECKKANRSRTKP